MTPKRPEAFDYEFEKTWNSHFYLYDRETMFEVYRKAALEIKAYAVGLEEELRRVNARLKDLEEDL